MLQRHIRDLGLDGFVVPRSDEHQGEYVGPHSERLAWLTGFTGSAGTAVVLQDKAAIFIDGRYTLQAREQTDTKTFEQCDLVAQPPADWIARNLQSGHKLGFDPWLHTVNGARRLEIACKKAGAKLVAVDANAVDAVWSGRPAAPHSDVFSQPTQYAGVAAGAKTNILRDALAEAGADAAVLTVPESIAWAFNIRGKDVPHTPVMLAFAILRRTGEAELFIDKDRVQEDALRQLDGLAVFHAPAEFPGRLKALSGLKVLIDPAWCAKAIETALKDGGAEVVTGSDPCLLPKARKNPVEQEGARLAHIRDGAAMVRFLRWLDENVGSGELTEIDAAVELESCRRATGELQEISFDSISAAGPNAALPHYRVTEGSNQKLETGNVYLIDSGGQYLDGTTDITRTVAIGAPSDEMRDRYTRVLKGHIAIARARFPKGTTGAQLDTLARLALWEAGVDFAHGTGHGVGSYLSVHEGPQRIAKTGMVPLEPGMIISNEPGYYKPGEFGIRIENLVIVQPSAKRAGEECEMYELETITFCPIDTSLVDVSLLSVEERTWFNDYHADVQQKLSASVRKEEVNWLKSMTIPI
ncbi:MAG: aminopeptidase P family protein [Pseudomonadota bacterium]